MSSRSLQSETIVSRLSLKLGGRLAHCEDCYRKIGTSEGHINIIRIGYKPTRIKQGCIFFKDLSFLSPPPIGSFNSFPLTKIVQLGSHRSYYMTVLKKSIIHSSRVLFKVSESVFQPYQQGSIYSSSGIHYGIWSFPHPTNCKDQFGEV